MLSAKQGGAGFRWNPDKKCWWTEDANIASKLSEWADITCQAELDAIRKKNFESTLASKAVTTDREIPCPQGLSYYPFQKAGIAYAMDRKNTLLGDDMGLGKTVQAIGIFNADESIKKVLVLCPATIKTNWYREIMRFSVRKVKVGIGDSKICPMPEDGFQWVILNYDVITKHKKLKSIEWDMIICDECHRLKNPKTIRGKFIYGEYGNPDNPPIKARRKVFLTGTPIVNRPSELFPIISFLDPETWAKKWKYFMSRYCNYNQTRWGCDIKGANLDRLPELQEILRRTIMVRRLKSDVLTELPAKTRQIIEIEPTLEMEQYILAENECMESKEATYEELKVKVELAKAGSEESYRSAVKELQSAMQVSFEEMARLRHETALAKVPAVIEDIKDFLEAEEKVVCFMHHKDCIEKVAAAFPGQVVTLTGDTTQANRQAAIDAFQIDPVIKVFVGSITAAGVGITLTAASTVIFGEFTWVPGEITQAEDRCHRIGQKDAVNVRHIVLNGSLDAKLAKTLVEKQEIIELALDKEVEQVPITPGDQAATVRTSRQKIEQEAMMIGAEQVEAIHEGLRCLASMCDGARSIDGTGFNKIDTNIGKSLAKAYSLSAKQAALGKRLLIKYKKQLPESLYEKIKEAA
jgi:SWI/SNF-related matrix-associated actin-dependent regulator of chromatin subfamily A-like protein 1